MPSDPMVEALAEYAHNAWAGWLRYMFEKADIRTKPIVSNLEVVFEPYPTRWWRQMHTSYAELPEVEKESDREEARKILGILRELGGVDAV